MSERALVRDDGAGAASHREVAYRVQHRAATQFLVRSNAGAVCEKSVGSDGRNLVNTEPQRVHQLDFQGIQVAAPLAIAALGALYAIAFSRRWTKTQNRSFSRPAGVRLPRGEILTRIEERANYQPRTQAPGRTKTGGTSLGHRQTKE